MRATAARIRATRIYLGTTAPRSRAIASYNQSMRSRTGAMPAAPAQPPFTSNPCTPAGAQRPLTPVQRTPHASHAHPQPRNERTPAVHNRKISRNPLKNSVLRKKRRSSVGKQRPQPLLKEVETDTATLLHDLALQFSGSDAGNRFLQVWKSARIVSDLGPSAPAEKTPAAPAA